jgi:hypothetical protein
MEQFPREDFARLCERYGFKPSDYSRPFDWGEDMFSLVGFNERARKYPCIGLRHRDDTAWVFSPAAVQEQFRNGGIIWEPEKQNEPAY